MKFLLVALLAVFFFRSYAEDISSNGSQRLHQAPAETFELTPSLDYDDITANGNSGSKLEFTGPVLSVLSEYGFTDFLSLALRLKYTSLSSQLTPSIPGVSDDQKGLNDPELILNGRIKNVGPGAIRLGTSLFVSMEKSKTDSSGNSNVAKGGFSLEPFAGYELYFGQHTFGARISYNFLINDAKQTTSSNSGPDQNSTITGGDELKTSLFYELTLNPTTILGFGFDLLNHAKSKSKDDSTGSTTDSNSYSTWDLNVYLPVQVAENVMLLPKFDYGAFGAYDTSGISSINGWHIEMAARIVF
jgi:hypothetical protein